MTLKQSFPTLEQSMADAEKKPPLGVSQGRETRDAHGAREAAFASSEHRYTGREPGDNRAIEQANIDPTRGEERAAVRADSRRTRSGNTPADPFEAD